MNEKLLQFIWQFRYFSNSQLFTTDGRKLSVIHPGIHNKNQGPDFSEAKIKIDNTLWAGNIELHIQSSDWHRHKHNDDKNYSNIILHAVWQHDMDIKDDNGESIVTIELQHYVPKLLIEKYEQLMHERDFVSCKKYLPVLTEIGWLAWKERLAAERLHHKAALVLEYFKQTENNWEETFWWMLAKAFGAKINSDIFLQVAQSLPLKILGRHKHQLHQLEALLFGQASLLNKYHTDDYASMLFKEYNFLTKKYSLQPVKQRPHFLRMRPANFPTVRLAQLAVLIKESSHLFSKIKSLDSPSEAEKLFHITANDYWHYHYMFDEETSYKPKSPGRAFIQGIIINTIIPVFFAYGSVNSDEFFKKKSIEWLALLPQENNSITNEWERAGILNSNAFDSQSLIELKNNYCNLKRCLDCAVGNKLLKA